MNSLCVRDLFFVLYMPCVCVCTPIVFGVCAYGCVNLGSATCISVLFCVCAYAYLCACENACHVISLGHSASYVSFASGFAIPELYTHLVYLSYSGWLLVVYVCVCACVLFAYVIFLFIIWECVIIGNRFMSFYFLFILDIYKLSGGSGPEFPAGQATRQTHSQTFGGNWTARTKRGTTHFKGGNVHLC